MTRTAADSNGTRRHRATVVAAVLALVLTGCVAESDPGQTSAAPTVTETPASTPTPSDAPPPTLVPNGTAAENKPFFDYLNNQAITAAGGQPDGPAFINSLRAGGFAVEAMELTPDITTVGVKADSVQFSVHAADACLIGQWGTVGGYTSIIAAPLATGKCFVGQTRPIDF
ncbi:DUF6993 domain-containing protein [Agreia bicolorata]|uniref:DUF6993 domain-containing protein n=1 Tax=Agreia bicolorata TaxID=110935 RepID=UPI001EE739B3|nr:hypothetical protein [Agreia bicolorata]